MKTSYNSGSATLTTRGFSIAAFFVAIAAFLGFGAHMANNMQATSTVNAMNLTSQVSSNSNWQTYTNSQFGFSVQYPQGWHVGSDQFDEVGYYLDLTFCPDSLFQNGDCKYVQSSPQNGYSLAPVTLSVTSVSGGYHPKTNADITIVKGASYDYIVSLNVVDSSYESYRPEYNQIVASLKSASSATQSASYNSTNPNMSGGLNSSVQSNQSVAIQTPTISISPTSGPVGTPIAVTLSGNIPSGAIVTFGNDSGISGYAQVSGKQFVFTVPASLQASTKCTAPPCIADPYTINLELGTYKLSISSVDRSTGLANEITSAKFVVTQSTSYNSTNPNMSGGLNDTSSSWVEYPIGTFTNGELGISFQLPGWQITNNTSTELDLSGGGDSMDITYVQGSSITTTDAKFGSLTYYYDANTNQWMVKGDAGDLVERNPNVAYPATPALKLGIAGSYPVFTGTNRWLTYIIPLSHQSFLKLHITGSGNTEPLSGLMKTITIAQ